ncbi:MAG TPA: hypothetical protein VF443_10230 [Nitrospira sp.]
MSDLMIFPTPLDAHCELTPDTTGIVIVGVPALHPSGRPGQKFTLPPTLDTGNGAQLVITAPKKVQLVQRGILWCAVDPAYLQMDDFHLADEKVCPDPVPIPPPTPTSGPLTPLQRIQAIYATGRYDLSTKAGCGQFTEACCADLHDHDSPMWGHIRKSGAQNQYNGHAVDAIMLLGSSKTTKAGIYDLITDSESPNAKPAMNFSGDPVPDLWYYPA